MSARFFEATDTECPPACKFIIPGLEAIIASRIQMVYALDAIISLRMRLHDAQARVETRKPPNALSDAARVECAVTGL